MPAKSFSLGRGLSSLIPKREDRPVETTATQAPAPVREPSPAVSAVPELGRIHSVMIGQITPNSRQPRHHFDRAELESLMVSIREHGIIEPLVARKLGENSYELIAGERRLRAATALGLTTVPVILRETSGEREKLLLALVENLSRQDLNVIEEAQAYRQLSDEFGLTQEDISQRVGKSRSTVANIMRLLGLPSEVQQAVMENRISPAQAKVLAGITDAVAQQKMFTAMLGGGVTVRVAEEAARQKKDVNKLPNAQTEADAESLRRVLGTKVAISGAGHLGAIKISYFSDEEYRELMKKLGAR